MNEIVDSVPSPKILTDGASNEKHLKPIGVVFHGFQTPSIGWEQPFEMLKACHERVQRMLVLLQRLQVHVKQHGADAVAVEAAQDVMRYFDKAAPLHHLDEEEQIFPLAMVHGDAQIQQAVLRLQQEHGVLDAMWLQVRADLVRLIASQHDDSGFADTWPDNPAITRFTDLYIGHVHQEETLVYPCVQVILTRTQQEQIGEVMAARRIQPVGLHGG